MKSNDFVCPNEGSGDVAFVPSPSFPSRRIAFTITGDRRDGKEGDTPCFFVRS